MTQRLRKAGIGAAAMLTLALAVAPGAQARQVSGHWFNLAPAIPYRVNPLSGDFAALVSSTWTGTWTGQTVARARGTLDFVSGDGTGTIRETFTGFAGGGDHGTLGFREHFEIDGDTSSIHIEARIVRSGGDFEGSRGHVTFDGLNLLTGQGGGTYQGRWRR